MPILGILASNARPYSLLATVDTSQIWTVPLSITKISVFLVGGGGWGEDGESGTSSYGGAGGYGGAGSPGIAFKDYSVLPNSQFQILIGGNASASEVAPLNEVGQVQSTIAWSGHGVLENFVSGWSTVPGYISASGRTGAFGGARRTSIGSGVTGGGGLSGNDLTLDLNGLGTVTRQAGGSGPGGGGGARAFGTSSITYAGGGTRTSNGSTSGGGGSARAHFPLGNPGTFPSYGLLPYGAGGAGGGGGGSGYSTIMGFSDWGYGTPGTIGGSGVVYIYGS